MFQKRRFCRHIQKGCIQMELIYVYIDKYRNYKEVELPLSGRFDVKYDKLENMIFINRNEQYQDIYPSYIKNINAVVGRNSVGKTNLLDLIGMKIDDRNKNNAEYRIVLKKKNKIGYRYPDDVEKEIQYAEYFLIYYLGIDDSGEELFCFEGNCISSSAKIVNNTIPDFNYFDSKGWFSVACYYHKGKFEYKYDMNIKKGEYELKNLRIYGDYRGEQDKLAIISFRENYNPEIYDHISLKPQDDYKIAIPRRIAKLKSNLWINKIKVLLYFLQEKYNGKADMFSDKEYTLKIKYYSPYIDKEHMFFQEIYTTIDDKWRYKCKVIEDFIKYIYAVQLSSVEKERVKSVKLIENEINTYEDVIQYYISILEHLIDYIDGDAKRFFFSEFNNFVSVLDNRYIKITSESIDIVLNKDTQLKNIEKVIDVLLDRDYKNSEFEEMFAMFSGFFEPILKELSDSETNNLGIYASVMEQIDNRLFSDGKEKFILIFDEPEINMHPELARNFINDIVKFLGAFADDRCFQIIISTHSPFILSDILSCNTLFLEKDSNGMCKVQQPNISIFSANIHDMLCDGFFMEYTIGEYSRKILDDVIDNLFDEKIENDEKMSPEKIKYIISNVGEPILKAKLQNEFDKKYLSDTSEISEDEIITRIRETCKMNSNPEILRDKILKIIDGENNEFDK